MDAQKWKLKDLIKNVAAMCAKLKDNEGIRYKMRLVCLLVLHYKVGDKEMGQL